MSSEESRPSNHHRNRARKQRRRRVPRLVLDTPAEQTLDYPGFFVLPRRKPGGNPDVKRTSWHNWWSQCKEVLAVLLVIGSFVGALGYFFSQVTPPLGNPPDARPAFVSDPKALTNADSAARWWR